MNDLIERLEKATGPSRALDGEIFRLIDKRSGDRWELFDVDVDRIGVWYRECREEKGAYISPAFYTASIDAALTLVPNSHTVYLTRPNPEGTATTSELSYACVAPPGLGGQQHAKKRAHLTSFHKSFAIALCIAALKARLSNGPIGSV
jgi:hypothetical protein